MKLRKLLHNDRAELEMILTAVVLAIMLAISILIVFNIFGALDTTSLDASVRSTIGETSGSTEATNATDSILTNVNTFYTVAPILLIVVAAVGILSYVLLLRRN